MIPEPTELIAHAAFRLVDAFTAQAPLGKMRFLLDREVSPNNWALIGVKPEVTAGGILMYPRLEKRAVVPGPSRKYRFRVESPLYQPEYQASQDGREFDAFPYNDDAVLSPFATQVEIVRMYPGPQYSFAPELPVLRGVVIRQSNGRPVAYAEVSKGVNEEKTLTDSRGEFALPLRRIQAPQFDIDVVDLRTGESRTKTILVPDMLGINIVIDIL